MSLESFVYRILPAPLPFLWLVAAFAFLASVTLLHFRVRTGRTLVLLVTTWLLAILLLAWEALNKTPSFIEHHNYSIVMRLGRLNFQVQHLAECRVLGWENSTVI